MICPVCSLWFCEVEECRKRLAWLAEVRGNSRRHYRRRKSDEQLKADIIQILGRLVGEKAVDEAKARAINGTANV